MDANPRSIVSVRGSSFEFDEKLFFGFGGILFTLGDARNYGQPLLSRSLHKFLCMHFLRELVYQMQASAPLLARLLGESFG